MLGWEVVVMCQYSKAPEANIGDGTLLAAWMGGLTGTDWLDHLVSNGQAMALGGNGYPFRWQLSADVLRSVLSMSMSKPREPTVIGKGYYLPSKLAHFKVFNEQLIASLQTDEVLVVEAWDQS